jgi:hypothetical protein
MSRLLNLVIEQELHERITELTKRVYTLGRHFILALSTHTLNLNHFKRVKILVSGCFHGQPRIHFLKSHAPSEHNDILITYIVRYLMN